MAPQEPSGGEGVGAGPGGTLFRRLDRNSGTPRNIFLLRGTVCRLEAEILLIKDSEVFCIVLEWGL